MTLIIPPGTAASPPILPGPAVIFNLRGYWASSPSSTLASHSMSVTLSRAAELGTSTLFPEAPSSSLYAY
jgi:hypothetical protein